MISSPTSASRSLAPILCLSALAIVLAGQPAQAHGIAHGGLSSGFLHPLLGTDHLLLLIGVGAAASYISGQLLLWALAGAIGGGIFGAMGGGLPAAEVIAALAISAVAVLVLRSHRSGAAPALGFCGTLIAGAVAVHAMLHGQEAPAGMAAASWWLGAFAGSLLVSGGTYLVLRRLPAHWTTKLALLLALFGGFLVLGPIGLLAR
ncbi:HupE/UreJ family protein [Synechococcus sp. CS-1325]|uniref:HupE/UreJ family protein n=1 Tax=unclassified Synechococcus TaxID=2626047 RepID=UPI000DB8994E|nr:MULTISPECIES: HupE/UreJ family protein [unclassified Synechococcus]PZU99513.1 MAG: hydrogenase/urease accessory protein [Cyanobium sp.]MCT0199086.1 HupE/UreJ family protein [Synechococcus sp. CS-1325]MCT0212552.1 HupE/UreJ family protein [Synechococcus sp. CS-1326]MCT0229933.1 HupE/UreJ family protein [Synechococcus sp. CS-1324]MCT0232068.1 HupE/UreJ family protein [Synechococcus sp. CS-1327]